MSISVNIPPVMKKKRTLNVSRQLFFKSYDLFIERIMRLEKKMKHPLRMKPQGTDNFSYEYQ